MSQIEGKILGYIRHSFRRFLPYFVATDIYALFQKSFKKNCNIHVQNEERGGGQRRSLMWVSPCFTIFCLRKPRIQKPESEYKTNLKLGEPWICQENCKDIDYILASKYIVFNIWRILKVTVYFLCPFSRQYVLMIWIAFKNRKIRKVFR